MKAISGQTRLRQTGTDRVQRTNERREEGKADGQTDVDGLERDGQDGRTGVAHVPQTMGTSQGHIILWAPGRATFPCARDFSRHGARHSHARVFADMVRLGRVIHPRGEGPPKKNSITRMCMSSFGLCKVRGHFLWRSRFRAPRFWQHIKHERTQTYT